MDVVLVWLARRMRDLFYISYSRDEVVMTLHSYVHLHRGRQSMLAKALGISPSLLSMWVRGRRKIPVHRCLEIERATIGVVRAGGLRPDISFRRREML